MDIRVGPEPGRRTATWIARRLRDAVQRRGTASLALSGGSTAPPMIDALLDDDVPWSATAVWQVDERVAPDGADGRNANQLAALPCRVHLMPVTSRDLRSGARRYASTLPSRFDVVHLGLGVDGHTASWPPGDASPVESDRLVEVVPEFNGFRRMTLTGRVVNGARARVVLTTGRGKREMVERFVSRDRSVPITAVRSSRTWVFVDSDAAP